jgi:hypothetical protein
MRSKLLKNNRIGNFTNGNPINNARDVPILNETQQQQAALVRKLPKDFPIAGWESMNTKQQLQAMKFSGLNAQEQWTLLNTNEKLSTLSQYSQAQTQSESAALAARVAASLVNTTAKAAATAKAQAAVGKPTVSTSLQNAALNGQLGGAADALSASLKATSSSSNTLEQKSGSRSAKLGGSISAPTRASGQSPAPTPTPTPSQTSASASSPNETPQPEPAPSPETTPNVGGSALSNGAGEAANSDTAYKKDPIEYLFGIDTTFLSEESRNRLYYISRKFYGDGVVPPGLYSSYLSEIGRIKEEMISNQEAQRQKQEDAKMEMERVEYFARIKSGVSSDAVWGTGMIHDQRVYNKTSGTFGLRGNVDENACGAIAIHNVNQILGLNTRFDELLYSMQKEYQFTTNRSGKWGTSIDWLSGYYVSAGGTVKDYDSHSKIPNDHDAYIVMYVYKDKYGNIGAHYVAAEYDKTNDCYEVYNDIEKQTTELWDTLLPSSYLKIAAQNGNKDKILVWNVFGIDMPKIPDVKNLKAPIGKTGTPVTRKGAWRRTNK